MKFFKEYWKTLLVTAVILTLSLVRFSPIEKLARIPNSDKYVHFLMYVGLAFIVHWDYKYAKRKIDVLRHYILACFVFPIVLGGMIEILQSTDFIGRNGDIYDFIANTLGVFTGWIIFKTYIKLTLRLRSGTGSNQ